MASSVGNQDEDDGYGYCDVCGEDLSDGSSHYHCVRCDRLCSMFGHQSDAECAPDPGLPAGRTATAGTE